MNRKINCINHNCYWRIHKMRVGTASFYYYYHFPWCYMYIYRDMRSNRPRIDYNTCTVLLCINSSLCVMPAECAHDQTRIYTMCVTLSVFYEFHNASITVPLYKAFETISILWMRNPAQLWLRLCHWNAQSPEVWHRRFLQNDKRQRLVSYGI